MLRFFKISAISEKFVTLSKAMYKTRNPGIWNGMWETWGMAGMLYSGERRQKFWGMSSNILGNIAKHSEFCWTFQGMSPNILENVVEYSEKCSQTLWWMLPNISGNVLKYLGEYCQIFCKMLPKIMENLLKHSGECLLLREKRTLGQSTVSWNL